MAYDSQLRNRASGWELVEFLGCETDQDGYPNRSTAERIVKHWGVTKRQAKAQAVGK